eukprot:410425-Rhodomonas_salina.2
MSWSGGVGVCGGGLRQDTHVTRARGITKRIGKTPAHRKGGRRARSRVAGDGHKVVWPQSGVEPQFTPQDQLPKAHRVTNEFRLCLTNVRAYQGSDILGPDLRTV